ncbi:hypothetical protein FPV67DRAFT_1665119 [Lyophyllum atratum]|nr:hypothetical protein FPV67DRAFT_1665119 [Lyophyllum atratum]
MYPNYAAESPEISEFVQHMMKRLQITEQHVRKACIETYGSLELAMETVQADDAEDMEAQREALEEMYPNGGGPIALGAKPTEGERVTTAPIRQGVWLRVWGDNLASLHCYCFDFVDENGRYMRTPDRLRIYSEPTGAEVFSIERSVDATSVNATYDASKVDENWETYVIQEGTNLRIVQHGRQDIHIQIPTRDTNVITLQPAHYLVITAVEQLAVAVWGMEVFASSILLGHA